jgi:predicted ATPase
MKLDRLHIAGYRCLADVDLELRDLMVLIGPNASGKTSFLEVLTLLRDGVQGKLGEALSKRGGLNEILSKGDYGGDNLQIEIQANVESKFSKAPLCYRLAIIQIGATGYGIGREKLQWQAGETADEPAFFIDVGPGHVLYSDLAEGGKLVRPTWSHNKAELTLAQAPRMFQEIESFRNALKQTRYYSQLDASHRAVIRLPQSLTPATWTGPHGENLYSALYNLRIADKDSYQRIEEALQTAFSGFDRLEFPVVGAGQVTLAWYQKDLPGPFYSTQLSEGMLRFLWLTTLLLSPDLPPITLIDEPEVSLHPELLKLLSGLMRDAALHTQLIVATHSPDLVRWLEPNEVIVLDKEGERATLTWADTLDLDEWLKSYTLAELWLMGEMGGRP